MLKKILLLTITVAATSGLNIQVNAMQKKNKQTKFGIKLPGLGKKTELRKTQTREQLQTTEKATTSNTAEVTTAKQQQSREQSSPKSSSFFGSWFSGAQSKISNATKWVKRGTYAALGFLGYKMIAKPVSSFILGKKITKTVDSVVNMSLVVGGIAGLIYFFRKNKKSIIKHINDVKELITSMRKYFTERFDKTDSKIDSVDQKVEDIQSTLSGVKSKVEENNYILKGLKS